MTKVETHSLLEAAAGNQSLLYDAAFQANVTLNPAQKQNILHCSAGYMTAFPRCYYS